MIPIADLPDWIGSVEGRVNPAPSKEVRKTGCKISRACDLAHRQPFPTYIGLAMHSGVGWEFSAEKRVDDTHPACGTEFPDWVGSCRRLSSIGAFKESREGWRRPLPSIRSFSPPDIPNLRYGTD
ncbi:MAG: hypothetical protein NTV80_16505 [Verrucomicrobia bacterium]|nr:hypothetical protein [Verrucomicrobiota bacterium]